MSKLEQQVAGGGDALGQVSAEKKSLEQQLASKAAELAQFKQLLTTESQEVTTQQKLVEEL